MLVCSSYFEKQISMHSKLTSTQNRIKSVQRKQRLAFKSRKRRQNLPYLKNTMCLPHIPLKTTLYLDRQEP